MNTIKLERIEQPDQTALALGGITIKGKCGWVAFVTFDSGERIEVDRIDGETTWRINGRWSAGRSFPQFWNGKLSRMCAIDTAPPAIAEAVEAELAIIAKDESRPLNERLHAAATITHRENA